MLAGARRGRRRRAEPCRGARLAEIGTILGGRYRLVELLGQGGMATIYRAVDTQLGRDVAVKLLRPEYLRDPDFSSRFRQEAQTAASLNHPNVVSVYDYGEDPSGPYIVMELVDGEDLATILRRTGSLPPPQAARIAGGRGARAGRRARPRHRPSRRQARQHPDRSGRPGQGRRLRHRPGRGRGPDDAARARRSGRSTTSARSRRAARPRRTNPTSTPSASSCTRCSPARGRGKATAPPPSRWPASAERPRTRPSSGRRSRRMWRRSRARPSLRCRWTASPRPHRWPTLSRHRGPMAGGAAAGAAAIARRRSGRLGRCRPLQPDRRRLPGRRLCRFRRRAGPPADRRPPEAAGRGRGREPDRLARRDRRRSRCSPRSRSSCSSSCPGRTSPRRPSRSPSPSSSGSCSPMRPGRPMRSG